MLNEAIKLAKGNEEEKAMQSISMPKSLKEDLVGLANGNNVSTNSLIVSILTLAVNDSSVVNESITGKAIFSEIKDLNVRKANIMQHFDDQCGFDPDSEHDVLLQSEINGIISTLELLEGLIS